MSTSAGRRGGRPGDRFGKYLRTVRGEIRIPSLSSSSLAIRSWPHSTFSRAILRISSRSSFGIGGRPTRDFIRQRSLQPARCQRIIVAGCTTTNALRQSKSLARTAKLTPSRWHPPVAAGGRARCTAPAADAERGSRPGSIRSNGTAAPASAGRLRSGGVQSRRAWPCADRAIAFDPERTEGSSAAPDGIFAEDS